MPRHPHYALLAAGVAFALGCAGESPTGGGLPDLVLSATSSSVAGAGVFGVRLAGPAIDSLASVSVSGVRAYGGLSGDTLVQAVMPLGPVGPVSVRVEAWSGRTRVSGTVSVQRAAAPAVGDEAAFVTTMFADIDARLDSLEALPIPAGVSPTDYAADVGQLRLLADSLQTIIATLGPSDRTLLLTLLAGLDDAGEAGVTASIMASAVAPGCSTWRLSMECVARSRAFLTQANARTQTRLAYTVALTAVAVLSISAAPVLAVIAGALALANVISSASDFSAYITSRFDEVTAPAVRMLAEFEGAGALRAADVRGGTGAHAAAVALPVFRPNVPVLLPIVRQTRNVLPGDSLVPAVGTLPSLVRQLRTYWDDLMDDVPTPFRVAPPAIPATVTDTLRERAEFSEVVLVSITAGGAAAAGIQGQLSGSADSVRLALLGDPGSGRDLTVRLALDGDGAGRVEFEFPVRFEPAPPCAETVSREGHAYPVVYFAGRCWMAENLRATQMAIQSTDRIQWLLGAADPATEIPFMNEGNGYGGTWWTDYGNTAGDLRYGRIYNWHSAALACPGGWRLPDSSDLLALETALGGGTRDYAYALLATGTADWPAPNSGATNSTGFGALPGGQRTYGGIARVQVGGNWEWQLTSATDFVGRGQTAYFWTGIRADTTVQASPEIVIPRARMLVLSSTSATASIETLPAVVGASVRCVLTP